MIDHDGTFVHTVRGKGVIHIHSLPTDTARSGVSIDPDYTEGSFGDVIGRFAVLASSFDGSPNPWTPIYTPILRNSRLSSRVDEGQTVQFSVESAPSSWTTSQWSSTLVRCSDGFYEANLGCSRRSLNFFSVAQRTMCGRNAAPFNGVQGEKVVITENDSQFHLEFLEENAFGEVPGSTLTHQLLEEVSFADPGYTNGRRISGFRGAMMDIWASRALQIIPLASGSGPSGWVPVQVDRYVNPFNIGSGIERAANAVGIVAVTPAGVTSWEIESISAGHMNEEGHLHLRAHIKWAHTCAFNVVRNPDVKSGRGSFGFHSLIDGEDSAVPIPFDDDLVQRVLMSSREALPQRSPASFRTSPSEVFHPAVFSSRHANARTATDVNLSSIGTRFTHMKWEEDYVDHGPRRMSLMEPVDSFMPLLMATPHIVPVALGRGPRRC